MTATRHLIVFAMKEEAQGLFETAGFEVLYTGIGKVNAAYHLMRELSRRRANGIHTEAVLNFGTAGSFNYKTHELVECTRFAQRDMDVSPLGIAPGVTPFDVEPPVIEVPKRFHHLPSGVCGTGDSFETGRPKVECEIVDMEAYSLAKICRFEALPFVSVKYITDGSDHNAHNDWAANLPRAASRFLDVYREILSSGHFFDLKT